MATDLNSLMIMTIALLTVTLAGAVITLFHAGKVIRKYEEAEEKRQFINKRVGEYESS